MGLPVTIAKMIEISMKSQTKLPPEFLEYLIDENIGFAIVIYATSTKTIRLIPTQSGKVVKLTIQISELTPGFLDRLGIVLTDYKVDTLYSSGICFTEDSCQYEGYIDHADMKDTSIDPLKNELQNIKGISSVFIKTYVIG